MSVLHVFLGFTLFLFGLEMLSQTAASLANGRTRRLLFRSAASPVKGFFLGAAATAILQSSSGVIAITVGLVDGGLLTLRQAVGIILGSNLGTTATGWLLCLGRYTAPPGTVYLLGALLGILLFLFSGKHHFLQKTGQLLTALSLLLTGMRTMAAALMPLAQHPILQEFLLLSSSCPAFGFLSGMLLTAAVQSSSASIGLLQAFAVSGTITWGSAIPILLGQNIGTCFTALLAGFAVGSNGRRAALVHLFFNLIGAAVCSVLLWAAHAALPLPFLSMPMDDRDIALAHTLFNLVSVCLMLPFPGLLERLTLRVLPDSHTSFLRRNMIY